MPDLPLQTGLKEAYIISTNYVNYTFLHYRNRTFVSGISLAIINPLLSNIVHRIRQPGERQPGSMELIIQALLTIWSNWNSRIHLYKTGLRESNVISTKRITLTRVTGHFVANFHPECQALYSDRTCNKRNCCKDIPRGSILPPELGIASAIVPIPVTLYFLERWRFGFSKSADICHEFG